MRRGLPFPHACLALSLLVGCGDDVTSDKPDDGADASESDGSGDGDGEVGDGDGEPGDGDGEPGDGDGASGDGDGAAGDGDGDGDGDPPPPFVPFAEADWARGGIAIDRVVVNQAISIDIVANGMLIPVEQRTGKLVRQRNTLIQVFWSVPPNWQARPITAKLHVRDTNGALSVGEVTRMIDGPPSEGSINGAITFSIAAPEFYGNMEFFVELWEGEGGHEGIPASVSSPSAPAGGMQPIGVTDEPMEAKVVLVPVKYDYGNCHTDTTSVINDNYQALYDWFFAQNPIESLDLTVHPDLLVQDTQLTTLSQINAKLVGLRFNDFAEPNEYYHAIVNACAGGVDGAGGLAPGTPGPIKGAGDLRVSTSLWADLGFTRDAFVHELGHNQGRPHSPCGNPDGPDMNYPHPGSSIGAWGFNILSFSWYNPGNYKDYMSYCSPTWVSDWTWNLVHEQVRQLTSWDHAGGTVDDELMRPVLHGWVHPSGLEQWWLSLGTVPREQLTRDRVRVHDAHGRLLADRPAAGWTLDDGHTRYVMAELPSDTLDVLASIEWQSDAGVHAIPASSVTRWVRTGGVQ